MNFYDKIHEMIFAFHQTTEYKKYISLKLKIKEDKLKSKILEDFKNKQKTIQMEYIKNNGVLEDSKKKEMEKLFNIIIKDEEIKEFLDTEIKIDIMLADMQKILAEGVREINEF
ncbi:MAG: YlbF family regulator [Clostridia bacterium]